MYWNLSASVFNLLKTVYILSPSPSFLPVSFSQFSVSKMLSSIAREQNQHIVKKAQHVVLKNSEINSMFPSLGVEERKKSSVEGLKVLCVCRNSHFCTSVQLIINNKKWGLQRREVCFLVRPTSSEYGLWNYQPASLHKLCLLKKQTADAEEVLLRRSLTVSAQAGCQLD